MRAVREGQVPADVGTADVEAVRIGEDRGVAVGRGDGYGDLFPGPDAGAAELDIGGRVPVDDRRGGFQAQ